MAEVARNRYVFEGIGKDLHGNLPEIARSMKAAKENAVLVFSVDYKFGVLGAPDPTRAIRLCDAFDLDGDCLVIEPDSVDLARLKAQSPLAADDYLHLVLANHTGKLLAGLLGAGDHFAVGPGRPVNHIAHYIARCAPQRRLRGIRVTPLAGRFGAHSWAISGPRHARPMDADDATYIVALALEGQLGTEFSSIGHSLFAETPDEAQRIMRDNCRFQPGGLWADNAVPKWGVIGVGAVGENSGHRLAGLFQSRPDPSVYNYLQHAAGQIAELISRIKGIKNAPGCVLSDVVNRYYLALPLPGKLRGMDGARFADLKTDYADVLADIDALNGRVVATEWAHLRQIPSLIAVAGGDLKHASLWTLLLAGWPDRPNKQHIIKGLNTDLETAKTLWRAQEDWKACSHDVQQWCLDVVARMFGLPLQPTTQRL